MEVYVVKERITSTDDFYQLKDEWQLLENGSDMTVYQSFEWNYLLVNELFNTFANDYFSSLFIYKLVYKGEVKIILPIILQKHSNKTKWFGRKKGIYILGHNSYSDYINAIYKTADCEDFDVLFQYIKKEYGNDDFYIDDIIENTAFDSFLQQTNLKKLNNTVSVHVNLPNDEEIYTKSLSKHVRQNLRTAVNRMKKDGIDYRIDIINNSINDYELLNKLRKIHIERMADKNMVKTDFIHIMSSRIRIMYRKYKEMNNNIVYDAMHSMGDSVFVVVYLNESIVGYLYGLKEGSVVRIMQNCFDENYKFYSPLFRGAYDYIISCIDSSIDVVDFTRGDESYKYQLNGEETRLKHYSGTF